MPFVKTGRLARFKNIQKGKPFSLRISLYTKVGHEEEKDHIFIKVSNTSACLADKSTHIYMKGSWLVTVCNSVAIKPTG